MKKWIAVVVTMLALTIAGGGLSFFSIAKADPGDPVIDSLKAIGFNSREEFVAFFAMEVDPREVATCPLEIACVRVLREKNESNFIIPFRMTNPTSTTFDGWRVAGQTGGRAKVPPGTWMVEGITVRTFGKTPSAPQQPEPGKGGGTSSNEAIEPSGQLYTVVRGDSLFKIARQFNTTVDALVSANNIQNRNLIFIGQVLVIPADGTIEAVEPPTASEQPGSFGDTDRVRQMFGVTDSNVSITPCDGENNCFAAIKRDASGNPQPFHLTNPTSHKLDGQLTDGSIGIPAGFDGNIMGATLRP